MTMRSPQKATYMAILLTFAIILPFQFGLPIGEFYLDRIIYLPVLFAGRCMYFGRNGDPKWIFHTAICWLIFFAFSLVRPGDGLFSTPYPPIVTYIAAMAIFVGLMAMRIKRAPRLFRFFADISYSLYLLHLPVGSLVLGITVGLGMNFTVAFAISITSVILVSWAFYRAVENPSRSLGIRLSAKFEKPHIETHGNQQFPATFQDRREQPFVAASKLN
jgi:peptidoglycan/LPS O-acetylase OafA/YrhL